MHKKHILVLEPFGGGSHAAFYRGWQACSRHRFTILELPPVHWKWRSRHAALTLAEMANAIETDSSGTAADFDVVFCSEMLNLAEWRGFASDRFRTLPAVAYFHENQFTYPLSPGQTRDYQYAYTNVLTAIAADQIWFNSAYHRDEFANAARAWLRRMPDHKHLDLFESAMVTSSVCPPGYSLPPNGTSRFLAYTKHDRPLTIGWVARWEHDKRPDVFVEVVQQLLDRNVDFELILLGQQFAIRAPSLERLMQIAGSRVVHCGYAQTEQEYWDWLGQMDVVVSTADHEFFGIGILEAVVAGARPLLPNRLAYPEVFELERYPSRADCFYQSLSELVEYLVVVSDPMVRKRTDPQLHLEHLAWNNLSVVYDSAIDRACTV